MKEKKSVKSKTPRPKATPNTIVALIASRFVGAIKREMDAITKEMEDIRKDS